MQASKPRKEPSDEEISIMINSVMNYREPQINADERRLNVLFLDIIGMAFEKEREWVLNPWRMMGKDKNQSGIKRNPLAIIKDKFSATNLRLSAFICGLKFDNTRQQYIISKWTKLYNSEKDGAAHG